MAFPQPHPDRRIGGRQRQHRRGGRLQACRAECGVRAAVGGVGDAETLDRGYAVHHRGVAGALLQPAHDLGDGQVARRILVRPLAHPHAHARERVRGGAAAGSRRPQQQGLEHRRGGRGGPFERRQRLQASNRQREAAQRHRQLRGVEQRAGQARRRLHGRVARAHRLFANEGATAGHGHQGHQRVDVHACGRGMRRQQRAEPQPDERQPLAAGAGERLPGRGVEGRERIGDGRRAGGSRRIAGIGPFEAQRPESAFGERDGERPLAVVGRHVFVAPRTREHHGQRQFRLRADGRGGSVPPRQAGVARGVDQHRLRRRRRRAARRRRGVGSAVFGRAIRARRGDCGASFARDHDATASRGTASIPRQAHGTRFGVVVA